MLKLAGVTKGDVVYDLGSGDGRIPIAAAGMGARAVGMEISPELVAQAVANAEKEGVAGRVRFLQRDLFETDISEATVVTLYLLPALNAKLLPKLNRELKPGHPCRVAVVRHGGTEAEGDDRRQRAPCLPVGGADPIEQREERRSCRASRRRCFDRSQRIGLNLRLNLKFEAFMLRAFVITLREGLEAFLIVAISLAYLKKSQQHRLIGAVHWGIGVSLLLSIGAAYLFSQAANQALWEGVLALAAAVLVDVAHRPHVAARQTHEVGDRGASGGLGQLETGPAPSSACSCSPC